MSIAAAQAPGLFKRLNRAEEIANVIIKKGQLHCEASHLRLALRSEGSTVQAVLKNWIYSLMESQPGQFGDLEEAENFVTRELLARLAETFPDAVNL